MNVKIYAAIYKKTSASGTSTLDPLPRYSYRLTLYTNPISDHIPIVCRNRGLGAVMGEILLLKYLKYFTKYSHKKVFKIVF